MSDNAQTFDQMIANRSENIKEYLESTGSQCWEEQYHLDEGTRDREYWHFGYLCALEDIRNLILNSGLNG